MKLIYKETRFNYAKGKNETKWCINPVLGIGSSIVVFILTIVLLKVFAT